MSTLPSIHESCNEFSKDEDDTMEGIESLKPQEGEYQTRADMISDCDAFKDVPNDVQVLV